MQKKPVDNIEIKTGLHYLTKCLWSMKQILIRTGIIREEYEVDNRFGTNLRSQYGIFQSNQPMLLT